MFPPRRDQGVAALAALHPPIDGLSLTETHTPTMVIPDAYLGQVPFKYYLTPRSISSSAPGKVG